MAKTITFKTIKISNFLSIGDEPVVIDISTGINLITGVNRDKDDCKNGVGKSTIVDAIHFALYGSPLRNIKSEVVANWSNPKKCSVQMEFDVVDNQTKTYKISRTLNPSRVMLTENGADITRTISATNETVKQILGMSSEIFTQSVILCLNNTDTFLSKTPAVKRKFVEDMFGMRVFSDMLDVIRKDINATTRDFDISRTKRDGISNNLETLEQLESSHEKQKARQIGEYDTRLTEYQNQLSSMPNISTDVEAAKNHIKKIKTKRSDLQSAADTGSRTQQKLGNELTVLRRQLEDHNKLRVDQCPFCHQTIPEEITEKTSQMIRDKEVTIENIQKQYKEAAKYVSELLSEIQALNPIIEDEEDKILQTSSLCSKKQQIESLINRTIQDRERILNEPVESVAGRIKDAKNQLQALQAIIDEAEKHQSILNACKYVLSDDGVRSLIIKKIIALLNSKLSLYLKKLDSNCICRFNEFFDEIITNDRGIQCSYYNFSGGERMRIDLAILFTFMDIKRLQTNINLNLGIYDELLDNSLDDKGIECVFDILKERAAANNEAIYVISHKQEALKHITADVIYLEKENNITKRIKYE